METDSKETLQDTQHGINGEGFKSYNFSNNIDIDTLSSNPFITSASSLCSDSNTDSSRNNLVSAKVHENSDISLENEIVVDSIKVSKPGVDSASDFQQIEIPPENKSTDKESIDITNSKQKIDSSDMLDAAPKPNEEENIHKNNTEKKMSFTNIAVVSEIPPKQSENESAHITNSEQKMSSTHVLDISETPPKQNENEGTHIITNLERKLSFSHFSDMLEMSLKSNDEEIECNTSSDQKLISQHFSDMLENTPKQIEERISNITPSKPKKYSSNPSEMVEMSPKTNEEENKQKVNSQHKSDAFAVLDKKSSKKQTVVAKQTSEIKSFKDRPNEVSHEISSEEKVLHHKDLTRLSLNYKRPQHQFSPSPSTQLSYDETPGKKREREEKVRLTKEKLEKEKLKKLQSLKEAMARSEALKRLRDEEKRKRMEEVKRKEEEHRMIVEQRRRKLYEKDLERKQAILKKTAEKEAKFDFRKPCKSGLFMAGFSYPANFFVRPPRSKFRHHEPTKIELNTGTVKRSRSQAPINLKLENNSNNLTRGVAKPARRDSLLKSKSLAHNLHRMSDITVNRGALRAKTLKNANKIESQMETEEEDINRVITPIDLSPNNFWLPDDDAQSFICDFNQKPVVCCKRKLGSKTPAAIKTPEERASRARSVGNLTRRNRSEMSPQSQNRTVPNKTNKKIVVEPLKVNRVGRSKTPVPTKTNAPLKPKETPRSSRSVKDSQKEVRNNNEDRTRQKPERTPSRTSKIMTASLDSPVLSDQRRKSTGDKLSKSISVPNHNKVCTSIDHFKSKRKSLGTPMKECSTQDNKGSLPKHTPSQNHVAPVEMNGGKPIKEAVEVRAAEVVTKVKEAEVVKKEKEAEVVNETEVVKKGKDAEVTKVVEAAKEGEKKVEGSKELSDKEMHQRRLAENRRLAREKAEREAEEERVRQEKLKAEEEERLRREEEEERRREEEEIKMVMEARKAEEERFRKAVEEEEKRRRLEEERQEAERKEKLEAEQRAQEEQAKKEKERQEREEKEAQAKLERKKKLEMIMKRVKTDDTSKAPETNNQTASKAPEKAMPHPASQPIFDSQEASKDEQSTFKSPLLRQMLGNKLKNKTASSSYINLDAQQDKQDVNDCATDATEAPMDTNAASSVSVSNVSFEIAKEVSDVDADKNNSAGGDEIGVNASNNLSTSNNTIQGERHIPEITVNNREGHQAGVKEDAQSNGVQESISEGCIRKSDNILFFQQLQLNEDSVENKAPRSNEEVLSIDLIDIKESNDPVTNDHLNNNNSDLQAVCNDNYILSNIINDSNNNQTADATNAPSDNNEGTIDNKPSEEEECSLDAWLKPQV